MLKKIGTYHLLPLLIALGITYTSIRLFNQYYKENFPDKIVLSGKQLKTSGFYPNFDEGLQAEIDFVASIKNKDQLTIFGSSEFTKSIDCSYFFLPDSVGIPTLGIGHENHQTLCILAELMAVEEYLDQSKICVVISPGWFTSEGTNTYAFTEFLRPNFASRIVKNPNLNPKFKAHLGSYIQEHEDDFSGLTIDMETLTAFNQSFSKNPINKLKSALKINLNKIKPSPVYEIQPASFETTYWNGNYDSLAVVKQNEFVKGVTNNKLFVYDAYYSNHLIDKEGNERKGKVKDINLDNNPEWNDFQLLIEFLKSKNANCSFIIQPLNPYYYSELDKYDQVNDKIVTLLNNNQFPYLNMHVTNKEDYQPGTLSDIMHLGGRGWTQINSFLDRTYHEK